MEVINWVREAALLPRNYYVLLSIAVLSGLALVLNLLVLIRCGMLRRRLRTMPPEGGLHVPVLGALVDHYSKLSQQRGVRLNAAIYVDRFIGTLAVWPFPRITLITAERFTRYVPGAVIIIGLGGNFLGWMVALSELASAWTRSASLSDEARIGHLVSSLQQPLHGLGTAFVLSLAGLAASLVLSVLLHLGSGTRQREALSVELEHYLDNVARLVVTPADERELLSSLLAEFREMTRTVNQTFAGVSESLREVLQGMQQTVTSVQHVVDDLGPSMEAMRQVAREVRVLPDEMKSLVKELQEVNRAYAGGAVTLESQMAKLLPAVAGLAATGEAVRAVNDSNRALLNQLGDRIKGLDELTQKTHQFVKTTGDMLSAEATLLKNATGHLQEQNRQVLAQAEAINGSVRSLNQVSVRLEGAATRFNESQDQWMKELKQAIAEKTSDQVDTLVTRFDQLNRVLQGGQAVMHETVGRYIAALSHPVYTSLSDSLSQLVKRLDGQPPLNGSGTAPRQ